MTCQVSKFISIPLTSNRLVNASARFVRNVTTVAALLQQHRTSKRKTLTLPRAQYGGRHTVTMLPGGGIGPELMSYVKEVFRYGGVPVDFEIIQIDSKSDNEDLEHAITSIKRNGVAIKGHIDTSVFTDVISHNVALRNELDLYVNVLTCKSYDGVVARQKNVDVCIVRQNTEGEYAMLEHESISGVVESMKVVTRENSERIARFAFDLAVKTGRKKMTIVHKANIMKLSDGLFLEIAREVGKDYQNIVTEDMIIDNCCMQLVSNPHQFDAMLMTNLYGTVVSNVVCGLVGGAGLHSGRNYGDLYAIFEPGTRSAASAIAGKNVANPVAMLNAAVDMLEHLGHQTHANILSEAINQTVNVDKIHTPDLGGDATSTQVVENIIKHVLETTKSMKWTTH